MDQPNGSGTWIACLVSGTRGGGQQHAVVTHARNRHDKLTHCYKTCFFVEVKRGLVRMGMVAVRYSNKVLVDVDSAPGGCSPFVFGAGREVIQGRVEAVDEGGAVVLRCCGAAVLRCCGCKGEDGVVVAAVWCEAERDCTVAAVVLQKAS